ncbi:MAG: purine-nucleoside phosphorylase [Spirochaetaceae bacterium]|jgi:purine-nucleoside phosphorylase|nr:purine-nucleoside phosphorylase [Spirochaetaceae bacterium]
MSIHLAAQKEQVAPIVLLPGDPLRAKFIAETFLEKAECYSSVRNMYGFTGYYKNSRVSVQGTGMGIPSISIYANELFSEYNVQKAIRIGTAGSLCHAVPLRAVVLASGACTDSAVNLRRFNGQSYAPVPHFDLLHKAYHAAENMGASVHAGNVYTTDVFYSDTSDSWKLMARYGVRAVEMETAELYTLAAKYGRQALSILTISDSLVTGESTSSEEREKSFKLMMQIALDTLV